MRIGICAYWFNRGQGVVARQLRSALDALGHETFVLARPTRAANIKPSFVDHSGVWDQPGVTDASRLPDPGRRARRLGARRTRSTLALFDQNYEFEAIAELRAAGVATAGRFVWEQFSSEHVEPAKRALDVDLLADRLRAGALRDAGDREPPRALGHPPGAAGYARPSADPGAAGREAEEVPGIRFFYPAGFLSKRKPLAEVLKAFRRFDDPAATLVIKAQVERELDLLRKGAERDRRVEVVIEDLPTDEHLRLFAAADVCVAPSRWEGLGLHLYESMALGLPVITNDAPPMNEIVRDRDNGLLVPSRTPGPGEVGDPRLPDQRAGARRGARRGG